MSGTSGFVTRYPVKETAPAAALLAQATGPATPYQYAPPPSHSGSRNKLQITPEVAFRSLEPLISSQLQRVGFQGCESSAMESFEGLCVQLITHLSTLAQEYATLSNRAMPHAKDMLAACNDCGMDVASMHTIVKENKRKRRKASHGYERPRLPIVVAPPVPPKPDELLPSDSEPEDKDETPMKSNDNGSQEPKATKATSSSHPRSLQSLPSHFPKMPPKHTYLRTDPPPPVTTSLSSLQQKINNAAIIQDSLRNLIQATEAPAAPNGAQDTDDDVVQVNQPVPPGLAGFVNWEAASGVRRPLSHWKV